MEVAMGGALYIFFIVNINSWRHGAEGTCCLTRLDGLAHDGGAVWCHGSIDGRKDKFYANIYPEDCSAIQ
jgi:hypothetical protein